MFPMNSSSIRFNIFLIALFWFQSIVDCEIVLSPEDVKSICNQTRSLVNTGSDPSYVAELVSEQLEGRFNLRSVTTAESLPAINTERLMIRLLVSDFLGDRVEMIDEKDDDLEQRQRPGTPDNPITDPTYVVKVDSKDKNKKGVYSDVNLLGIQLGTVTLAGTNTLQDMSRIKAKNSDVEIKRVDITTTVAPANIANFVTGQIAQVLPGRSDKKAPDFDSYNRKLTGTLYSLRKCQDLDLNGDMKSSDPESWWRGMENIRLSLRREL